MIHELGHYTAGKIFKFKINEFSIGFGKAIFSKTNKKTGEKFSLRLIPLGGYCAFEGEDKDVESKDSFNAQKPWKRLIVLFSGALFNFISAIIMSVILLMVVGNGVPKVAYVYENNINDIQVNDVILKVNGTKPGFLNGGISKLIGDIEEGKEITLLIKRDGKKHEITVKEYNYDTSNEEAIGVGIGTELVKYNFGEALLLATPFCFEIAWQCLVILWQLISGQLSLSNIGGPISTVNAIATASSMSLLNLLLLVPLIAVNLAVFNLLPIPALDGARMLFVFIEWIRKKPINRDLEAKIHVVGLIVLFSFVILVDILQLFVFKMF